MSPIANYSTTVPVERSLAEVQQILARAGARSILIDFDETNQPSALAFQLPVGGRLISYRLPIRPEGIIKSLKRDGIKGVKAELPHARQVAWRTVRDWIRAQLALVEAEQASLAEVMLPYAIAPSGRTLYQELEARPGLLSLPSA